MMAEELKIIIALIIFTVLLAIGTGLGKDDFLRLLKQPKAAIAALCCQMLLLPVTAVIIIKLFALQGDMAMGLLLLSVCPGGTSSNLFTRLAQGDTALSVSLTAFNSMIAAVSIPALLYLGQLLLGSEARLIEIPVGFLFQQLVFITLLPLSLGMLIHHQWPDKARRIEPMLMKVVTLAFFIILVILWHSQWSDISKAFTMIGGTATLLLISTSLTGFIVARLLRLNTPQESALVFEVGIQNNGIAFFIALNILNNIALTYPPAVYSVIMTVTGLVIVFLYRLQQKSKKSQHLKTQSNV